jgi:hypothetical protein
VIVLTELCLAENNMALSDLTHHPSTAPEAFCAERTSSTITNAADRSFCEGALRAQGPTPRFRPCRPLPLEPTTRTDVT